LFSEVAFIGICKGIIEIALKKPWGIVPVALCFVPTAYDTWTLKIIVIVTV